ncbi:unnamed protein product, partial [Heterotrigona itama]
MRFSTGKPAPTVSWHRDDKLVSNKTVTVRNGVTRNELVVKNLGRNDVRSMLTCNATNNNRSIPLSSTVYVDMNCKYRPAVAAIKTPNGSGFVRKLSSTGGTRLQETTKSIYTADSLFKAPEWIRICHGFMELANNQSAAIANPVRVPNTRGRWIRRILSMSGTLGQRLYNVCVQQMTRPDYPVFGRAKFRGIVPQFRVNGEVSADSLVSRQPVLKQSSALATNT